MSCRISK